MQIFINAKPHQLNSELTIAELLQQLQVDVRQIAVEQNAQIISRSSFDNVRLKEGDVLELVEFVGGG